MQRSSTKSLQISDKKRKIDGSESFVRYKVKTKPTPPRYPTPYPFIPRVKRIGLAKLLVREVFEYNFKLFKKNYRAVLMSRPCIYGVFSGKLGGFNPIKELCVGCLRCVQEYPEFTTVDKNPDFLSFSDSYFLSSDPNLVMRSPFSIIWEEAKSGKIKVGGMGYKGKFSGKGWDQMWTDMSEIVRPTRDGIYGREYISTLVNIGRKPEFIKFPFDFNQVDTPRIDIPLPIIFDFLPNNLNHPDIQRSIQIASQQLNTLFVTDGSEYLKDTTMHHILKQIILFVTPQSLEDRKIIELTSQVKAITIDFEDYSTEFVNKIKGINSKAILIVRLKLRSKAVKHAEHLVQQGIDCLHLYADYHGSEFPTVNSTEPTDTDNPRFIADLIQEIHLRLIQVGTRSKITIIASGGITLAEHVPKAIICGADLVAINTSVLVALQIKFQGECRNSETGKIIAEPIDPTWGAQRLINLIGSWHNQLIEILSAMGIKEVRRLVGDTGRALFAQELEKEAFHDIRRID